METTIHIERPRSMAASLTSITSIILLGFLAVGIPYAFIPQYVTGLGFGTVWTGILLGAQSLVTLLTRHYAGTQADLKGAKTTTITGLWISAVAGLVGLSALTLQGSASLAVLFVSRLILGLGESLMITGALSWGIGLIGLTNSGRLMSWSGIAMYSAIAVSASLSAGLDATVGPLGVFGLTVIAPLAALAIAARTPATPVVGKSRLPFYKVISKVWRAGIGLSLSAVGFAAIAGFAGLYFEEQGWQNAPAMMAAFGAFFVVARLFFGHAPDKHGGKRVGAVAAVIEAAGLVLIWIAPDPMIATAGAALTGFGYSLVFPSLGKEAVRNIEPQFRGVGLGAYVAFFDLALGITGPIAGLIAAAFGISSLYIFGAVCCLIAVLVARKI